MNATLEPDSIIAAAPRRPPATPAAPAARSADRREPSGNTERADDSLARFFAGGTADALDPVVGLPANRARALLPGDVLGDEEIIVLLLKPSLWYVPLASLGGLLLIAFVTVLLAYLARLSASFPLVSWSERDAFAFGAALLLMRLGWQALDWWNQVYVLTDRRIIACFGVVRRAVFQAPLTRIQHVAVVQSLRERLAGCGTLAFATAGSDRYDALWLFVRKPFFIYRRVNQTIDRYGSRRR